MYLIVALATSLQPVKAKVRPPGAITCQKSAVNYILKETTEAIWCVLQPQYMPRPNYETWVQAAKDFWTKWQFPGCVGAIDGKHVAMVVRKHNCHLELLG